MKSYLKCEKTPKRMEHRDRPWSHDRAVNFSKKLIVSPAKRYEPLEQRPKVCQRQKCVVETCEIVSSKQIEPFKGKDR